MTTRNAILSSLALATMMFFGLAQRSQAAQKIYLGDYYHPKLKAGEATIRRVVVMPPTLTLEKNTMKGRESLEKENEKIEPVVYRAMIRCLRDAGVRVSDASPTEEMLAKTPDFRETVNNLQRGFDSIEPVMFSKLKDVKKGRFKVGADVVDVKWNEEDRSDTLIFVRGFGGRTTKAKAFASGGGLLGAALSGGLNMNLVVSFVDAASGDVLLVKGFFVGIKDDDTENRLVKDLDKWLKPNIKKGTFGATS
jgi:hypothetical protein